MRKSEIISMASQRGICVYEQYQGRRVLYKVRIPIFTEGKVIPTGYKDEIVWNIKEVRGVIEEIWKNEEYRVKAFNWLSRY